MDAEKIKSIILPVIKSYDVEITNLFFRYVRSGALLRVYVDKKIAGPVPVPYPGSRVDLKTLEKISKEISAAVEAHGAGGKRLILEVSSPGLDRPITAEEEYKFFVNHAMKVTLKHPINERRNFTGKLVSVEEAEGRAKTITIETQQGTETLDVSGIEKARLNPLFVETKKKKKGKKKCHGK